MRQHLLTFVRTATEAFELEGPVYEFGVSLLDREDFRDGLRNCFPATSYVGCDLSPEAPTTRLDGLIRLPFPDAVARTVVCIDALQYVADPLRTAQELKRILAPGGTLVFGASFDPDMPDSSGRFRRPTHELIDVMMAGLEATLIGWQGPKQRAHTLLGLGVKTPASEKFAGRANRFLSEFQQRLDKRAARTRAARVLRRILALCFLGKTAGRKSPEFQQSSFVLQLPVGRQFKHGLLSDCLPHQKTGTRIDFGG